MFDLSYFEIYLQSLLLNDRHSMSSKLFEDYSDPFLFVQETTIFLFFFFGTF